MRNFIVIILICLLIISAIFIVFRGKAKEVCFENNCFSVEVVDTPQTREIGLMNRKSLDADKGMLFIFETEGVYPFWMKNTLIPLDMIWISKDGKIVDIKHNAVPCKIDPCEVISHQGTAKYVLEINGGLTSERNINIGAIVNFVNVDL